MFLCCYCVVTLVLPGCYWVVIAVLLGCYWVVMVVDRRATIPAVVLCRVVSNFAADGQAHARMAVMELVCMVCVLFISSLAQSRM